MVYIIPKNIKPAIIGTHLVRKTVRLVLIHINPQRTRAIKILLALIMHHDKHVNLAIAVDIAHFQPCQ